MTNKNQTHPEYQYLDLLQEILDNGVEQTDENTGVKTYSIFGAQMRFNLGEGFPLLTTKRVYWKGVLHELYWFLMGKSNIRYLIDNGVHIWDDYPYKIYKESMLNGDLPEMTKEEFIEKITSDDEFAEKYGELDHIYGEMWRRWPANDGRKVDQIKWVIKELKRDPDAHNTLVSAWDPQYLYGMAKEGEAVRFPICHNMFQFNIKNGKLSCQLYQRSADIFLGVPFNIASYALLTVIIAHLTGNEPGEFIHTFGDIHIYENHIDAVREQLQREPKDFPKVKIESGVKNLDDFKTEHVILEGYEPHPTIKAKLVVSGGYFSKEAKGTKSFDE
ncbi:thymidylate synthase [Patescibacteria group bacterium]|nr:thymidylate synthase [Patescibacteria group bacterium]